MLVKRCRVKSFLTLTADMHIRPEVQEFTPPEANQALV